MSVQLRLRKSDPDVPWGFRLAGGCDSDPPLPLTIIKVASGSSASEAELRPGDVIIAVEGTDVSRVSLEEAQSIIVEAGLEFALEICRGDLSEEQRALIAEEDSNEEVFNIMEGSIPIDYPENVLETEDDAVQKGSADFSSHDLNLTDEEILSVLEPEREEVLRKPQTPSQLTEPPIYSVPEDIRAREETSIELDESETEGRASEAILPLPEKEFGEIVTDVEGDARRHSSEVLKALDNFLDQMEFQEHKWSTFLQKPKRSKPKSKEEKEIPKAAPYKVVIRTKKDLEAERAAKLEAEQAAIRAAEESERAAIEAERVAKEAEEQAVLEAEAAKLRAQEEEIEEAGDNMKPNETEEEFDPQNSTCEESDVESVKNETVVTPKLSALTVEQQLEMVKEQLSALSELPTTIQMTLSAITQQLQKIVKGAAQDSDEENELSCDENTNTEEDITELLVLESQDDTLSVVEEEKEETAEEEINEEEEEITEEERLRILADAQRMAEEEETKRLEEEEQVRLEEEARRAEQDRIDKKEKDGPMERPIILPGGRRWSRPDDATRSFRNPKMTDDKIDRTISAFYEVVTGRTIGSSTGTISGPGPELPSPSTESRIAAWCRAKRSATVEINFMKYQPPPKNLDYLQKSEVYKMIHDMEPSAERGIIARPEKVLSEQDYFVKNGQDRDPLPAQMER